MKTESLPVGNMLQGRYRILREIGGGGMGTVYLAEDTRLAGRRCAIKEMSPAQLPAQDRNWAVNAFQQEAHILARLQHPGLTAVTDFFPEGGDWYLVMEFVEGQTLDDAIAAAPGKRLPPAQALNVLGQLCRVLEYLHGQNPPVIFRDLKPSNVMLTPEGQVKLIDFGIARFFKPSGGRDTVNLGTPGYAAPEQYGGQSQSDVRADVYGLGVLLHQMLTGHDPTHTPFRLPPAESLNASVASHVSQAIRRATEHDPEQRFASVNHLSAAVTEPTSAHDPPLAREGVSLTRLEPRWLVGVIGAGAAVLLLIACGVGAILVLNQSSSSPTKVARATATPKPLLTPTRPRPTHTVPVPTATSLPMPTPSPATTIIVVTATPGPPTPTSEPPPPTAPPTLPPPTVPPSFDELEAALLRDLRDHYHLDNGEVIFVYRAATPPQIDGRLNEWGGHFYDVSHEVYDPDGSRSGRSDLSGSFFVAWDSDNLYLGVEISDDVHVQTESGRLFYLGDDVEIQLDIDLQGDFQDSSLSGDDYQIGLSAGDFGSRQPEAYIWRPISQEQAGTMMTLAARETSSGYILEAAIPWWALGGRPPLETAVGFCLGLSDNDAPGTAQQQAMVSTAPARKLADPTTWGTLVLVDWR